MVPTTNVFEGFFAFTRSLPGLWKARGFPVRERASSMYSLSTLEAFKALPMGSQVVPSCGLYVDSYRIIPKKNYLGAYA